MKAIAYQAALPISEALSLQDVELPAPLPGPRDLLVDVRAIAVNPVDTKLRAHVSAPSGQWKVLGWDVVGTVRAVGAEVTLFKEGDRVWYAGAIHRAGANSEQHVVDERIASLAPSTLDDAQAAAMPLTTITAWELLFDRFGVARGEGTNGKSLLIIGAAGGVGSVMTQLASRLTGLTVIGTASRPETEHWVRGLGAHHVIDHSQPLAEALKRAGLPAPDYVASLTHTAQHFGQIAEVIAPQGQFGLIDDPTPGSIDITAIKRKSVSLHWEFMFTRSMFETPDMIRQHELLAETARLIDAGQLKSTLGEHLGTINAANLKRAHALIESGHARGKIVLEGF